MRARCGFDAGFLSDKPVVRNQHIERNVAAPIGHIVCALALLNVTTSVVDPNAFLAGTSFPDIRYVTDVSRSATHRSEQRSLSYVLESESSFEAGRRFHVYVDREREKHMRQHNAYSFIKNGPLKTQLLKLVEDHILFDQVRGKINRHAIFSQIYPEELSYGLTVSSIDTWHRILKEYFDDSHWFSIYRYYKALVVFKEAYSGSAKLFSDFWMGIRTIGFLIYAFVQVVRLSRNEELRAIILDFYNHKMPQLLEKERELLRDKTVERPSFGPSKAMSYL